MQPTSEAPLRQLAIFAATHHIQGRSFNRSALLKPFDMLIDVLERSQHPADPGEITLLRAAMKSEILLFIDRIAPEEWKPGATKANLIALYVDLFFDGVLGEMHHGQVSKILDRSRILRAAYLTWFRAAIPTKDTTKRNNETSAQVGLSTTTS